MSMRRLLTGLALSSVLALAGCKCCHSSNCGSSPAVLGATPIQPGCSSCGNPPPPGVVAVPGGPVPVPPPGGGAYYPPPGGPFGASYGR